MTHAGQTPETPAAMTGAFGWAATVLVGAAAVVAAFIAAAALAVIGALAVGAIMLLRFVPRREGPAGGEEDPLRLEGRRTAHGWVVEAARGRG